MKHQCARCGFESGRRAWWDRHPVAAALFGLPAGFILVCVMLAYWWFTIPVTVIVCAVLLNRAARKRDAVATRADYEYRQEMLTAVRASETAARRAQAAAMQQQRHVMNRWPTTPIPAQSIRRNR